MKFLCICQCGHSRSVAMTRVLHHLGYPAVAIGAEHSGDAINQLAPWADKIIVMELRFAGFVPSHLRDRVVVFDVGPDRWSNPYNQELLGILRKKFDDWQRAQK